MRCPECMKECANYTCPECKITWRRIRTRTYEGDWVWSTEITPMP